MQIHRNRLANPFAISVSVKWRKSSCLVKWPRIEMCAPVAATGLFFVMNRRVAVSQAWRTCVLSVFVSRAMTFRTDANSGS